MRKSNVELFRTIATLMVLIVHFNGWFVGGITNNIGLNNLSLTDLSQLLIQSTSCCCVNCFLVISGWFGIKFKFSTFWKMWKILIAVYVPLYILCFVLGEEVSVLGLINNVIAFSKESYYIQLYLMLVFLSPMLNSFVDKYKNNILQYALVFCIIEFFMEFCFNNKCLIVNGYSLIHFIIIYLLGRAAFENKEKAFRLSAGKWIALYILMVVSILATRILGGNRMNEYAFAYSNPLVICQSFFLFFAFLRISLDSKIINWIASSSLFVYLLQITHPVFDFLCNVDIYLKSNNEYMEYLFLVTGVILIYFLLATLYGKLVGGLIDRLTNPIGEIISNKTHRFFKSFS